MNNGFDVEFQFSVDKIDNNSFYITEILPNGSNSTFNKVYTPDAQYDSAGAGRYIVLVIFFYATIIIFFIGTQVKSGKKSSDELDEVNAEKILRSMETEIFTREVLGELSLDRKLI
jgi:hypothetical protein